MEIAIKETSKHTASDQSAPQHTVAKSFLLHLAPGIFVLAAFLVLKPLIETTGFPPLLAFLLAILLIDVPFMLGVMFYEGKKVTGRFSLEGIILYRQKMPWKTFISIFIVAFIVMYLFIMLAVPIDGLITERLFSWLPDWLFMGNASQYEGYTRNVLVIVFTLHLLITGVILPWVEELYFRGYLLPRISRYGTWSPMIGACFFSLYHVWQLFDFFGVFLLGAGLGYVVWWKKDIRMSISLHVFANAMLRVFLLLGVLGL